jgi:hypothetical protein
MCRLIDCHPARTNVQRSVCIIKLQDAGAACAFTDDQPTNSLLRRNVNGNRRPADGYRASLDV